MSKTKQLFSLAKLESSTQDDPLELFYSGIKSQETKTAYTKTLREFLDSIEDFEGTFEDKARQFASFAQKEPDKLKQLLKNYAIYQKQRSEKPVDNSDYLSPSTIPNKFKEIKKFLKMNEIPIEWTNIDAIFPEITNLHQTRGYTTDEIRQILDYSTDVTSDFLILAESSSGMRIGGWENQVWGNIRPIYEIKTGLYTHDKSKSNDSRVVCASMVVYNDTSSKYLGLISIEAWDKLQSVRKHWIEKMNREPKPEDPIILTRFKDGRHFSRRGIQTKMYHIIKRSNIQKTLKKEKRAYEVPATHGMRKRWNKIMSEQKINQDSHANLIRKERLFGHKIGVTNLDSSYFFSEIEESVLQYLLAMPDLMISEEYRAKRDLELIQNENTKLQQTIQEKTYALEMIEELKAKFERFEKYEKQE
ncbi:hypothetical protein [Nitrosopumilus adriaticus]|uniref:hypothetical protein n=1 Tax=Nitrosopumilus adriaticus TaxID=1580092 RepID=UPI00352FD33A